MSKSEITKFSGVASTWAKEFKDVILSQVGVEARRIIDFTDRERL
jgi:hypothetical protein